MHKITPHVIEKIVAARKLGMSIPEISKETGIAKTTVQRYILKVVVPRKFQTLLREKQGGSKERAYALRKNIMRSTHKMLGEISSRDLTFLMFGLYWGEGTKRDFAMINSDPILIQSFIVCLRVLGISNDRLSFSIRVHRGVSIKGASAFWARTTGVPLSRLSTIEIVDGQKNGKLKNGMCRIRVKAGIRERLLIQSAISLIGKECNKRLLSV